MSLMSYVCFGLLQIGVHVSDDKCDNTAPMQH